MMGRKTNARALVRERAVRSIVPLPSTRWIPCGPIEIWPSRRLVRLRGARGQPTGDAINLTKTQCAILMALVEARGEPVPRSELLMLVRGAPRAESRVVDAHICDLRRRLGDSGSRPHIIVSVTGVGYAIDA